MDVAEHQSDWGKVTRLSELQNTKGKRRAKLTCTERKCTDPKLWKIPTFFIQSIKKDQT